MRIEWRYRNDEDALLTVDEDGSTALEVWDVDKALLSDFLNLMTSLHTHGRQSIDGHDRRDPEEWGRLVIARSDDGDVLRIDPELYWDRVTHWFRSQGGGPNPWRPAGRRGSDPADYPVPCGAASFSGLLSVSSRKKVTTIAARRAVDARNTKAKP